MRFFQPGMEPRTTPHTSSSIVNTYNDPSLASRILPSSSMGRDALPSPPNTQTSAIRINQMEYNPQDSCLYLALQSTGLGSTTSSNYPKKTINTISVWNVDLSQI